MSKENNKGGASNPSLSYKTKFKIKLKDGSILDKGSDVSDFPEDKIQNWISRGFLEEVKTVEEKK